MAGRLLLQQEEGRNERERLISWSDRDQRVVVWIEPQKTSIEEVSPTLYCTLTLFPFEPLVLLLLLSSSLDVVFSLGPSFRLSLSSWERVNVS